MLVVRAGLAAEDRGRGVTEDVELVEAPPRRLGLLARAGNVRPLWLVHASGRFDRPSKTWRAALTYARRKGAIVTGTEAAGRDKALFLAALAGTDWSYAHLSGAAEGEAYATWDGSRARLFAKPFAHKLTDKTWTRSKEYGGKQAAKVHALVVPLEVGKRRIWLAVVHMPLDNTQQRAECWVDCCRGLVELRRDLRRKDPGAAFVPVGDFNKNLREADEQRHVRANLLTPLAAVTSWVRGLPKAGTHGRQVIDYAIADGFAACQLLRDLPDSDHRAFRYRLRRK